MISRPFLSLPMHLSFAIFWLGIGNLFAQSPDNAFRPLFNGRDLTGWHGDNPHTTVKASADQRSATIEKQQADFLLHWTAQDGDLVNDGHGPYATSDGSFGDIELTIDYKTVPKADSGIYLRGTPQIQIWDSTKEGGKWDRNADKGSGGLFNNTKGAPGQLPSVLADKPFGEWNKFQIFQVGSRTSVRLNDQLVVDRLIMENYWDKERKTPLPPKGPIHLQTHGGEIRWRNVTVRDIAAREAIAFLRGDDAAQGFKALFNGVDFSGWQGDVDNYEVQDGSIVCKPGKGGILFTKNEYEDFVARVEFLLPPAGNNGLAIRYPGKGRASYDGMCELQIFDESCERFSQLDPRQYHGAAYGIAPSHPGYLRPVGEWNYQEVTVEGSRIRVELNGTVIMDTDLSMVERFKDDRPHPGKDLKRGHFGLAGHRDPVRFRNLAIKSLR